MIAIITLSLCPAPHHRFLQEKSLCVKCPAFRGCHPEDISHSLALVASRACVHRFNGMVAKKETDTTISPSRAQCRGKRQKYASPSLPLKVVYLHTFKSCYLRVWLPASMNLSTEILYFGTLTCLGTFSTTGSY